VNTIQSTLYGAKTLVHLLLGHTPVIPSRTTFNERLGIQDAAKPTNGEKVYLGIMTVGNKGHRAVAGDGGIALTSVIDHLANHASTYNPVPFALRRIDDDLPQVLRAKYALRKEMMVSGVNYYAYFGMRMDIDPADVTVVMKKITVENGQTTEAVFIPSTADLYPEPVELPVKGAVSTTDVSLSVSCVIRVRLDEVAIEEFINAAKIMHNGDERYAIMSEFALCTGADRTVSVPSTSGSVNFLETIGCQAYSFSMDHKALYYNSQELTLDFDLGNQLPLLGTASIPTLNVIP
jgi:hypothetical protein